MVLFSVKKYQTSPVHTKHQTDTGSNKLVNLMEHLATKEPQITFRSWTKTNNRAKIRCFLKYVNSHRDLKIKSLFVNTVRRSRTEPGILNFTLYSCRSGCSSALSRLKAGQQGNRWPCPPWHRAQASLAHMHTQIPHGIYSGPLKTHTRDSQYSRKFHAGSTTGLLPI